MIIFFCMATVLLINATYLLARIVEPPPPPPPMPTLQAAPPPPPPPRSPIGDRRSLKLDKGKAAAPPVVEDRGFGNMADMAAKVAQARAIRAKAAEAQVKEADQAAPTSPLPDGTVSRSRANEILARAKALAARAKESKDAHE